MAISSTTAVPRATSNARPNYYKQAVELDPQYARAWAELAGTYYLVCGSRAAMPTTGACLALPRRRQRASSWIRNSQSRRPAWRSTTTHAAARKGRRVHLRLAIALDPDDPLVLGFSSSDAVSSGDIGEAVDIWARIVAQDPLSPTSRRELCRLSLCQTGGSRRVPHRIPKGPRTQPWRAGKHRNGDRARPHRARADFDEAWQVIAGMPHGNSRDYTIALLYRAPGRRAEADAALGGLPSQPKLPPASMKSSCACSSPKLRPSRPTRRGARLTARITS